MFSVELGSKNMKGKKSARTRQCTCEYSTEDLEEFLETGILQMGISVIDTSKAKNKDDLKKQMMEAVRKNSKICDMHKEELVKNIMRS